MRVILLLCLAGLCLVGVRPEPDLSWQGQRVRWQDCEAGLQCATIRAPLDPAALGGQMVELALARLPVTEPARRIGSLVLNFGGPGFSGLEQLPHMRESLAVLRKSYDIVAYDPRGVGRSTGLRCANPMRLHTVDQTPETPQERQRLSATLADFAAGCAEGPGGMAPYLGGVEHAHDLDVIRAALGEPRLSYLGWSYGGHLGAVYSSLFPGQVGRMVLDSPAAMGAETYGFDGVRFSIGGMHQSFTAFADACVKERSCPLGKVHLDPDTELDNLVAPLDTVPLKVPGGRLDDSLALAGVAQLLETGDWAELRTAIRALMKGDGRPLHAAGVAWTGSKEYAPAAATFCTDNPARVSTAQIVNDLAAAGEHSFLFGDLVLWTARRCHGWPERESWKPSEPLAPTAPVLVVGTTDDPVTSYEEAEHVAYRAMADAILLKVQGDDHTAYGTNECATKAIDTYLIRALMPVDPCVWEPEPGSE
ncbi:alpha/beta hydrolase [Nonomuraea longicatena]|uniref:Alpha/beta hydrolase n=1 Tax=Nonomuraea longicatena TaxID=83682 RepID=A0ABN1P1V4_9ACTN